MWSPERQERGGHLLTVETEVNEASKSTNERGPNLVGSLGFLWLLFCLGCSSRPSTNFFFLTVLYFNSFVPFAQQAGQAAVLGRLSLSMCLWPSLVRKLCFLIFCKPNISLGSTTLFLPIFFKTHHSRLQIFTKWKNLLKYYFSKEKIFKIISKCWILMEAVRKSPGAISLLF